MAYAKPYMLDVVFIIDAIAVHKGTWWYQKKKGYLWRIDHGTGLPEAEDDLATEALVFMIFWSYWSLEAPNCMLLIKQKFSISPNTVD